MKGGGTTIATGLWRRTLRAVLCVVASVSVVDRANAELPREIRVVTYNIHHGEGMDKRFGLERIAKVVMAEKPDIVALQEVDQGTKRASGVDQPAEFARLMGMKLVFGWNIPFQGGGYGTAVLTRLPIRSCESVKLKPFYKDTPEHKEQRGVQVLKLGRKGEPGLWFLCTHLDFRPADDERMNSAKTINELIRKRGNAPAIIAGDLNATPESGPVKEFEKQWTVAGEDGKSAPILTFPADKPDRRIDYVMYRPADKWKVAEVRVLEEAVASDHRPVLTVLKRTP